MSGRAIVGLVLLALMTTAVRTEAAEHEPPSLLFAEDRAVQLPLILLPPVSNPAPQLRRPATLPALYAGFIGLQVLDARTTTGALGRGARETNPALSHGSQARIWAVKTASTASTMYFVEKIWKRNRLAAVLVMAGIDGGYAAIAAHNLRQSR